MPYLDADRLARIQRSLDSTLDVYFKRTAYKGRTRTDPLWHKLVKVERISVSSFRWTAECGYTWDDYFIFGTSADTRNVIKTAKLRCAKCSPPSTDKEKKS